MRTIPANDRRERFIANTGQSAFPFDYPIYADADLLVERVRDGVTTTLMLGVDYFVAGVGGDAGGVVHLNQAAQAGDVLSLTSNQVARRSTHYEEGSALPASSLNAEFNRIWISIQQLARQLGQTLRVPTADVALVVPAIPAWDGRSRMLLGFDADGITPIVYPALSLDLAEEAKRLADDAVRVASAANVTSGGAVARAEAAAQSANVAVTIAESASALATATDTRLNTLIVDSGNVPAPGAFDRPGMVLTITGDIYAWQPLPETPFLPLSGGTLSGALIVNESLTVRGGASLSGTTYTDAVQASGAVTATSARFGGHYDVFTNLSATGDATTSGIAYSTAKLKAKTATGKAGLLFESFSVTDRTAITYKDGVWSLGGFSLPVDAFTMNASGDATVKRALTVGGNIFGGWDISTANDVSAGGIVRGKTVYALGNIGADGAAVIKGNCDAASFTFGGGSGGALNGWWNGAMTVNYWRMQNDGWRMEFAGGYLRYISSSGAHLTQMTPSGEMWAAKYNIGSDARLKKDIAPLDDATCLRFVMEARPASYVLKSDPTARPTYGFIAQDFEAGSFPTLVSKTENVMALDDLSELSSDPNDTTSQVRALDYTQSIPLLTGALRNALKRIDTLEAHVKELTK